VVAVVLLLLTGCEVTPTPAVDEGAEVAESTPASTTSISPTVAQQSLATTPTPTEIPTLTHDNQGPPGQEGAAARQTLSL
jgi:hypothetical protein